MSRTALINIDTQQSFHHRDYWQENEIPAFQQAMLGLIEGCQARGIPVVDIFHVDEDGPFTLQSGYVKPMAFYVISRTWSSRNTSIMRSRIPGLTAGCVSETLISSSCAAFARSNAVKPLRGWHPIWAML